MSVEICFEKENRRYLKIEAIQENIVRIRLPIDGEFGESAFVSDVLCRDRFPEMSGDIRQMEAGSDAFQIRTSRFSLTYTADSGCIEMNDNQGFGFLKAFPAMPDGKPKLRIVANCEEGYYGFGEWFNGYRRTKATLNIYSKDTPAFAQHKRTYSPFPCFFSDKGYCLFVLNAFPAVAEIDTENEKLEIDFEGGWMDFVVIYGPDWKTMIDGYTMMTGRPKMLPMWAFGLWNTAYPVEDQAATLARIDEHRKRNIPLDAIVFDYHWEEGFHNFKWRKRLFPDAKAMLASMKDKGVHAGAIYTPYINTDKLPPYKLVARAYSATNAPKGTPWLSKDSAMEVYSEANKRGFLAHRDVTWWLGRGGAVDFTNRDAVDWWFAMQKPLMADGLDFFKNDGGEYLPDDNRSAMGLSGREYHNIYAFYYSKAVYEKSQETRGRDRALIYARSNWIGTQRFPATFLGDQTPEFKHFQSTMRCGLNMSLLGYAYWGADVLGLFRHPTPETHKRSTQWTIFSPIARYFSAPHDKDRNPWGFGEDCENNFREHTNLRMRLLPYYYRLAYEAFKTGVPIIRPLMVEFPDDPETKTIWNQAMIGDALMIAPVLSSKAVRQEIYFPKGVWTDWWSEKTFTGGKRQSIEVVSDRAPIFVRCGKSVMLGETLQHIPDSHRFNTLEIHFYAPFDCDGFIYEDDGKTLDYLDGKAQKQPYSVKTENGAIMFRIDTAKGCFDGQIAERRIKAVFHHCFLPKKVSIDGTELSDYRFETDSKVLSVEKTVPTGAASVWRIE